ncbi:MAG TPA: YARHG domain-containing protein [Clostridia bacterium]
MNTNFKFIALFLSISFIFSGCTSGPVKEKNADTLGSKKELSKTENTVSDNKTSNNESETILSLGEAKFNLNSRFDTASLSKLGAKELSLLRNSIYAKHGYIFSTKEYTEYFSQFSWYKPQYKNVEDKLNDIDKENIKTILSLEGNKNTIIKNSKDDKEYTNGKVDISLNKNSKKETLFITRENLKPSDDFNKPLKITLKIKDSQIEYKSMWNDGIKVSTTDFDTSDNFVDIYITRLGTDIQSETTIYRYDGTKLFQYDILNHFGDNFFYDGKGSIYYWNNDASKKEMNKAYNYKLKNSSDITDESLKKRLMSMVKKGE